LDEDETNQSIKKKNRGRVAPKMGSLDVDYRTLHDAFFKHQNKASIQEKLSKIGDLYYEGKEFEMQKSKDLKVGGPLTSRLRDALGMTAENSPPPWLINMQRFGPPPSYPSLSIPGLNACLPEGCTYGYHLNGWGKPPIDAFGRPLYGGNPFDAAGSNASSSTANWDLDATSGAIVTSDGKTVGRKPWGCLPMAAVDLEDDEDESSDEESSDDDSSSEEGMVESEGEDEDSNIQSTEDVSEADNAIVSTLDLRKQPGDETPAPVQQLYKVIQQTEADKEKQSGAVFTSDVAYIVPGSSAPKVPEGAESVLSKAPLETSIKRKRDNGDDDDDADLGKKFKF
jgi:splicing factor 3B subunit 2